jgi:type I restriction enzyme S subunit
MISRGARDITTKGLSSSGATLMPAGTVLFSSRAPIGYVAIAGGSVCTNQGFKSFVPTSGVDPEFLYYYLHRARQLVEALASGTTFKEISGAKARTIPIPIAPLPEQRRVVEYLDSVLSRLDAAVAGLERAQAKLKAYRASVLKAAIEGRLVPTEAALARAEKRDYEPAEVLLARILKARRRRWEDAELARFTADGKLPKDEKWKARYEEPVAPVLSKLAVLPEGWCWATVDQLSVVVRGASPRPAGDPRYFGGPVPWITVGALTADEEPYLRSVSESLTEAGRKRSRFVEGGTLLLTNSGATLGVPRITLIGGCINDGSVALLHIPDPTKLYMYFFFRTLTQRLRSINQGAAQPNLNTGIVRNLLVPVPPIAEQATVVMDLERLLSVATAIEADVVATRKRAARLRQAVLKWAFAGKLVDQDPADEPADKLLARIRAERCDPVSTPTRSRKAKRTA